MEEMGYELDSIHFLSLYSFHYSQYSRKEETVKLCFLETEDIVGLTNEYVWCLMVIFSQCLKVLKG